MIYQRGMMYKAYNREELLGKLGRIGIEMSGNCVVTKWDGHVVNATPVSEKYEIFDIVKYIKEKIDAIERNFSISKYRLILHRGRQSLDLLSDTLEIDGVTFSKSFHILNSTDRSRKLNFTTGLFCEDGNYYVIRGGTALTKSHIKGVTSAVETASAALEGETFAQQAESIRSLAGHKILLSNVRKTILGDKPTAADHGRFDAFKSCIRNTPGLNPKQSKALYAKSDRTSEITAQEDFFIDAMKVLQAYLKLFANNDSHTISKETEKIMKMTQWSIRNEILDSLGI